MHNEIPQNSTAWSKSIYSTHVKIQVQIHFMLRVTKMGNGTLDTLKGIINIEKDKCYHYSFLFSLIYLNLILNF
jgi:hypothetical protein